MGYYIYENWTAEGHKARVHSSDCPYCNGGKGIHPGAGDRNGQWHHGFKTFREALAVARKLTGNENARGCKHCNPH